MAQIVFMRRNVIFWNTVASANLYSLIATTKTNGIEPYAYIRTVFTILRVVAGPTHQLVLQGWALSYGVDNRLITEPDHAQPMTLQ